MPQEKDPTCRGRLIKRTDQALLVGKSDYKDGDATWWLPRSQIGYMKISEALPFAVIEFTAPEWLIEKKQFWELVP